MNKDKKIKGIEKILERFLERFDDNFIVLVYEKCKYRSYKSFLRKELSALIRKERKEFKKYLEYKENGGKIPKGFMKDFIKNLEKK